MPTPSSTPLNPSSTSLWPHTPTFQWFMIHHNLLSLLPPIPSSVIDFAYVVLNPTICILGRSINDVPLPHGLDKGCVKLRVENQVKNNLDGELWGQVGWFNKKCQFKASASYSGLGDVISSITLPL
ncbi:hypothetical protein VNO77_19959 [Canavalia gladiata]|uniref:Uncharacterized protein n=1 Tax=Canavalia gladiata TaxID=3824 RepID=A0AAN9LNS2_CANGL